MMKKIATMLFIAATTFLLGGCCTRTSFSLDNKTGQKIVVVSGHTGMTNTVDAGCKTTVPHTGGEVRILTENGQCWRYNICVPRKENEGCVEYWKRWIIACPELRLYLAIDPDGTIYALPTDKQERADFKRHQPLGYPMRQNPKQ